MIALLFLLIASHATSDWFGVHRQSRIYSQCPRLSPALLEPGKLGSLYFQTQTPFDHNHIGPYPRNDFLIAVEFLHPAECGSGFVAEQRIYDDVIKQISFTACGPQRVSVYELGSMTSCPGVWTFDSNTPLVFNSSEVRSRHGIPRLDALSTCNLAVAWSDDSVLLTNIFDTARRIHYEVKATDGTLHESLDLVVPPHSHRRLRVGSDVQGPVSAKFFRYQDQVTMLGSMLECNYGAARAVLSGFVEDYASNHLHAAVYGMLYSGTVPPGFDTGEYRYSECPTIVLEQESTKMGTLVFSNPWLSNKHFEVRNEFLISVEFANAAECGPSVTFMMSVRDGLNESVAFTCGPQTVSVYALGSPVACPGAWILDVNAPAIFKPDVIAVPVPSRDIVSSCHFGTYWQDERSVVLFSLDDVAKYVHYQVFSEHGALYISKDILIPAYGAVEVLLTEYPAASTLQFFDYAELGVDGPVSRDTMYECDQKAWYVMGWNRFVSNGHKDYFLTSMPQSPLMRY